jgi:hypothetical protein
MENECAACHMPMARVEANTAGHLGAVFAHLPIGSRTGPMDRLAADGVSCAVCHQMAGDNFGERSSFVGGFLVDTTRPPGARWIFGPFEIDAGRTRIMRSASGFEPVEAAPLQRSEMCATCHTLYTHALGPEGEVVGALPEQVPYREWLHSAYSEEQSCQSCHMPVIEEPVAIASVLGEPRAYVQRHVSTGGNFFMLNMLNRYRDELGVEALPHELAAAVSRTLEFLQSETATVSIVRAAVTGERLRADVRVENLAGHKLPTAYPSRRAWIQLVVRDGADRILFESGAVTARGLIEGNANDLDPARYEPHYREITRDDQVQVYERRSCSTSEASYGRHGAAARSRAWDLAAVLDAPSSGLGSASGPAASGEHEVTRASGSLRSHFSWKPAHLHAPPILRNTRRLVNAVAGPFSLGLRKLVCLAGRLHPRLYLPPHRVSGDSRLSATHCRTGAREAPPGSSRHSPAA